MFSHAAKENIKKVNYIYEKFAFNARYENKYKV